MNWKYSESKISGLDDNGELMAEADFINGNDGVIDINHIYVSPKYRGQGMADKTMLTMVDFLREKNLQATASCSYANSWFSKNEEMYTDVIFGDMKNQAVACKIDGKH